MEEDVNGIEGGGGGGRFIVQVKAGSAPKPWTATILFCFQSISYISAESLSKSNKREKSKDKEKNIHT